MPEDYDADRRLDDRKASVITFSYDLEGNFTSFNKGSERVTGYTREEAFQMNIQQLVAPESLDEVRRTLSPGRGVTTGMYVVDIVAKDGQRFALTIRTRLVQPPGKPTEVQCLVLKLAEPQQAQDSTATHQSEAKTSVRQQLFTPATRAEDAGAEVSALETALDEQPGIPPELTPEIQERATKLSKLYAILKEERAMRIRAEEALRKAHEDFEALVDAGAAHLSKASETLKQETTRRESAEHALQTAQAEFETRIEERSQELSDLKAILSTEVAGREQAQLEFQSDRAKLEDRLAEIIFQLSRTEEYLNHETARRKQLEQTHENAHSEIRAQLEEKSGSLSKSELALRGEQERRRSLEEKLQRVHTGFQKRVEDLSAEISNLRAGVNQEFIGREEAQKELQRVSTEFQVQVQARDAELDYARALLKDEKSHRQMAENSLQKAIRKLAAWVSELEQLNREMSLLGDLGNLLQACLTKEDAYAALSERAPQLFAEEAGLLGVTDSSQTFIDIVVDWGAHSLRKQRFAAADCWALRRGCLHYVEDTRAGLLCQHLQRPLPASYMCVPIMAQGFAFGVLHLSHQEAGGLTESRQRVAVTLAEHVALTLTNSKLHKTLLSQSIRDPLTTLFSRRFMEESLILELLRAARTNSPLGVIMLELDSFEDLREAYGRETSDAILAELAFLLQRSIRAEDIACRYSADKFAVILPETSTAVALERTEQIREAVKDLRVRVADVPDDEVTVSCGVAVFPDNGVNESALLQAADEALERAKQEGPDRVVIKT